MSVTNPWSQYQETQLKTATPGKLLIMTYDAAIRFANAAAKNIKEHNLEEQSTNIRKVQNMVLELISSLDIKADRQLAANLYSLYSYIFDKLTQANIHDDLAALYEAIGILTEMRATWAEAELSIRTGVPAAVEPMRTGA
jgi:flagellar secretion chaperone FliS